MVKLSDNRKIYIVSDSTCHCPLATPATDQERDSYSLLYPNWLSSGYSQASLRRVATKELSKYSDSFTSTDSSLLFYALVFYHESDNADLKSNNNQNSNKVGNDGADKMESDGFLSIKASQNTQSTSSLTSSSFMSSPSTPSSTIVASASAAIQTLTKSITDNIPATMNLPSTVPFSSSLFSSSSSSSPLSSTAGWSTAYCIFKEGNFIKFDAETQEWKLLFEKA